MDFISSTFSFLTVTSLILGVIILTLYLLFRSVFIDRSNGLPPGPRFRLPLIGNLHNVDTDIRKFLRRYRKQYGDIYSLYFGNTLVIIISGYSHLKEAFVKNGEIFSDRPKAHDIFTETATGNGIFMTDGELWKEHRQFSLQALKSFGMGRSVLEPMIHSEVQTLLQQFMSKRQPFDPMYPIFISVSNVTNALTFGGHFKHDDYRFKEIIRKMNENFANAGMCGIGTFIPGLIHVPGDMFGMKRTLKNAQDLDGFIREFAMERLQDYDESTINNYTSAFIKEMKKQERTRENTTYTMDQLVGMLVDLFIASTETPSTLLRWALVYLINFPEVQELLYVNIKDEIGVERLPSLQDRSRVPLIDAFMQECLRHADVTIATLGRATPRDTIFDGYLFPTEATIIGDFDSVNQDKELWKDPETFRPERFIEESGSLITPEYFVAFSLGRRSCLGESLARMELFLFLSAIVQNFKISATPGEDLSLGTLDTFGLSHVPRPFNVIATPRRQTFPVE